LDQPLDCYFSTAFHLLMEVQNESFTEEPFTIFVF